jgi:transcriptional regulator with XRE-family HTH domain
VSRLAVPPTLSIRTSFARLLRESRHRLGMSQETLSRLADVSRGQIAKIELGQADPSLDTAERLAIALGLEVNLVARPPLLLEPRQRDSVHAACSGYADRRLRADNWETAREVEIIQGRSRGWIDLLAFNPHTGLLLVVEIKTRLDDIGLVERQVSWYERSAFDVGRRLGWPARRAAVWLLALASAEVEATISMNRQMLSLAFPGRAAEMATIAAGGVLPAGQGRGLALIDPASRRREWLIRTRADGRRLVAPYVDYADAARRLAPGP